MEFAERIREQTEEGPRINTAHGSNPQKRIRDTIEASIGPKDLGTF
jgi:hypothetical protein